MKVYIITGEPYHDNSSIGRVFDSLKAAMDAHPADWSHEGHYVTHCDRVVAESGEDEDGYTYLIHEREVEG